MDRIIILGAYNFFAGDLNQNTHFLVQGGEKTMLVDCSSNPLAQFERLSIATDDLTDVTITHFHPDHVSGLPILLMNLWLVKRSKPLAIHGSMDVIDRVEAMLELFGWGKWANLYPVHFHRLESQEMEVVLKTPGLNVFSSPVKHVIPNLGLRFEFPETGWKAAYTSDTEPCPGVIQLAQGVDILLHEASGLGTGHSSAAQAGADAKQAKAKSLYFIHYPKQDMGNSALLTEARKNYSGRVDFATPGMIFTKP
jgi:ribonuclease Z